MDERDADGVTEFCQRHGFSKSFLYGEWRRGKGPRFLQVGDRRIITREAGADWRRELEAEAAATLRRTPPTNEAV